ncbi:Zinc finger BED domain-containing protein RICESLEEPER 4, partial [Linum grandiflorum]
MAPKHPKSSKPPSRSTRTAQNPTQAQLVQLQPATQSPAKTQNPRAPSPIRKSKRVKKVSFKNQSATWKDYNAYKDVKGLKMAECIHCGGILKADPTKNGISSLGRHTLSCQKKRLEAENSGQMRLNFQSSTDGTMSLGNWKFDQMTVRKTVVEMIILDELPFRFVEKQGFNRVMAAACPMFKMPCRKTVREDCLKLFLEEKERLR